MTELHIYVTRTQPATRYKVYVGEQNMWLRNPGNRLIWADCCRKKRPAKNLTVQAYYDRTYYSCKPGKGCKA